MTLPAKLSETTQAHLESLVAAAAPESQHRDYKRDLPSAWNDEAKRRFIADLVAMANASGGDIIYGIDEDGNACARAVVPQVFANADIEVRRLQDFIMEYAEPRLPGVQVQAVPVTVHGAAGHAVVVRVPQSWSGPHRSRLTQHFSVREGLRNRTLDVPEIRSIFLRTESQAQRIRDFRNERLGKVVARETPTEIAPGPCIAIHVVPTQAAVGLLQIDPLPYTRRERSLPIIGDASAGSVSVNFDGALGTILAGGGFRAGYTQQFRQGYFESVWVLRPLGNEPQPTLPSVYFERHVIRFVDAVRRELTLLDFSTEVAVFLALIGANETRYAGRGDFGLGYNSTEFDRRDVVLPDFLVPS